MEIRKVCVMAALGDEITGFSSTGTLFEWLGGPVKVGDIIVVPGPNGNPESAIVMQTGTIAANAAAPLMKAHSIPTS